MSIRASDDDRRRTVAALEQHTGAGRLTLDEFADRARIAHGARTLAELAQVAHDLPTDDPQPAAPPRPRRDPLMLLAVVATTVLALGALLAALR